MIRGEVIIMEENENLTPEQLVQSQPDTYTPRPKWQRVLAWIALGIVIVGIILYYINIITPY